MKPSQPGAKKKPPRVSPYDVMSAEFIAQARELRLVPVSTLPEIALAGRSNVGKSTLLNALCQRKGLARVSRTPGCTRGIIMYDIVLRSGVTFRLVDLPGYGFADRARSERRAWGPLIEQYLMNRGSLRAVIVLVDSRRGVEQEEADLADFLRVGGTPFVLVATKVDKLGRAERGLALDDLARRGGVRAVGVSGETGEGREDLMRAIVHVLEKAGPASDPGTEADPGAPLSADDWLPTDDG